MAGAEIWAMNILKIIVTVIAVHLTLTKIMPLVQDFLLPFIDKKATDALTSLFGVLIIVLGGTFVMEFVLAIGNPAFSYLSVLQPAFDLLISFIGYLQYVVIVIIGIAVLKTYKGKK